MTNIHKQNDEVFLNLVLEYVPETVYRVSRQYAKTKTPMPLIYVKVLPLLPYYLPPLSISKVTNRMYSFIYINCAEPLHTCTRWESATETSNPKISYSTLQMVFLSCAILEGVHPFPTISFILLLLLLLFFFFFSIYIY